MTIKTMKFDESKGFLFHDYQKIREFYSRTDLLSLACRETSLDCYWVRRNINGPPKDIKVLYAVVLKRWMDLWVAQETARRELSSVVKKNTNEQ